MRNELKVGLAILAAALLFYVGLRLFQDMPIFRGTFDLYTVLDDAGGLLPGNPVQVSGVNVGSVDGILITDDGRVRVDFQVDRNIRVPEGSFTSVSGLAITGSVTLALTLGPTANPPIENGGFVPNQEDDLLASLQARAPELVNRVDSLLLGANVTLSQTGQLLANPNSSLNQTLQSLRNTSLALEQLLQAERGRISRILTGLEATTASLDATAGGFGRFSEENLPGLSDSLALAVSNLNATLRRLDRQLDALDPVSAGLDTLLVRVNRGDGTLGRLVNDPSLYIRLDSAAANVNAILEDFQAHPGRYLRELELIDIL